MIIDKLFSVFRPGKALPITEPELALQFHQVNYFPPGKETYKRERELAILGLLTPASNPTGDGHAALLFEQYSYEECWSICFLPPYYLILLSDKGRKISCSACEPLPAVWKEMVALTEELLPYTTKRDDFPMTGFGHATFYFVSGRNVFVSKKHIPLMEKETNGFHTLHKNLLELRKLILAKM